MQPRRPGAVCIPWHTRCCRRVLGCCCPSAVAGGVTSQSVTALLVNLRASEPAGVAEGCITGWRMSGDTAGRREIFETSFAWCDIFQFALCDIFQIQRG